ncbi:hypothetical protein ES703_109250 [subsurface metagenome]
MVSGQRLPHPPPSSTGGCYAFGWSGFWALFFRTRAGAGGPGLRYLCPLYLTCVLSLEGTSESSIGCLRFHVFVILPKSLTAGQYLHRPTSDESNTHQ